MVLYVYFTNINNKKEVNTTTYNCNNTCTLDSSYDLIRFQFKTVQGKMSQKSLKSA